MSALVVRVFSFECDMNQHLSQYEGVEFAAGESNCYTMAEAKKYLRLKGWKFGPNNLAICPQHAGAQERQQ